MTESIQKRTSRLSSLDHINIVKLLNAVLDDNAAMRADIAELDSTIDTLIAKLNLDAGITDTNYAGAAAMTSTTANLVT